MCEGLEVASHIHSVNVNVCVHLHTVATSLQVCVCVCVCVCVQGRGELPVYFQYQLDEPHCWSGHCGRKNISVPASNITKVSVTSSLLLSHFQFHLLWYFSIDIHITDICVSAVDMSLVLK